MTEEQWTGKISLQPGVALYCGWSADNLSHRHWAYQISVGLDAALELRSGDTCLNAPGIYIAPNVSHRLAPANVCSLYLDPTNKKLAQLLGAATALNFGELPESSVATIRAAAAQQSDADALAAQLCGLDTVNEAPAKLQIVLQALGADRARQTSGVAPSRDELAAMIAMSPSRFSHWFKEQTGIPLRSYRKWLKLMLAGEMALAGQSLVDAAYNAGFADQAHLSRTFKAAFGVSMKQLAYARK